MRRILVVRAAMSALAVLALSAAGASAMGNTIHSKTPKDQSQTNGSSGGQTNGRGGGQTNGGGGGQTNR